MLVKETVERDQKWTTTSLAVDEEPSAEESEMTSCRVRVACGGRCGHIFRDRSIGPRRSMTNLSESLSECADPQPQ